MDGTTEFFNEFGNIINDFKAGWYLGAAGILYLLVQIIKGKFGFKIPYVTEWFEGKGAAYKTYFIWGLSALAGGLITLGIPNWNIFSMINGMVAGISVGMTASGSWGGVKQAVDAVKEIKNNKPNP